MAKETYDPVLVTKSITQEALVSEVAKREERYMQLCKERKRYACISIILKIFCGVVVLSTIVLFFSSIIRHNNKVLETTYALPYQYKILLDGEIDYSVGVYTDPSILYNYGIVIDHDNHTIFLKTNHFYEFLGKLSGTITDTTQLTHN